MFFAAFASRSENLSGCYVFFKCNPDFKCYLKRPPLTYKSVKNDLLINELVFV